MPGIAEYLDECYRTVFSRLVADWGITEITRHVGNMGGYYDAKKGGVIVRLVNDRGCITCEVSADDGRNDFVDVELLAQVLDHVGKPCEPHYTDARRFSLADQCSVLIERREAVVHALSMPEWERTRALARTLGCDRFFQRIGRSSS